jgi:prophage DNA circulation protein
VYIKLEELILNVIDDDLYFSLYDLQTAVTRDLNERAAELPRLAELTLNNSLPALVVSHDLYGNISQEQDIVDRNNVAHPSFVPGGIPIEVLTDV